MTARRRAVLVLVIAVLAALGGNNHIWGTDNAQAATTAQRGLLPSPCNLLPPGAVKDACEKGQSVVTNPLNPICSLIPEDTLQKLCKEGSGAVSDPLGTIGGIAGIPSPTDYFGGLLVKGYESLMSWVTSQVGQGVVYLLKEEVNTINNVSAPNLQAPSYTKNYSNIVYIAGVLGAAFWMLVLFEAGRRRNWGILIRGTGRTIVFFSVLGLLPWLMMQAVTYFDGTLAPEIMAGSSEEVQRKFDALQQSFGGAGIVGSTIPLILILAVGIVAVIGGLLTVAIFMLRSLMILLYIAFEAIALALWVGGTNWSAWANKTTKNLVGLSLIKVFAALVFVFGLDWVATVSDIQVFVLGMLLLVTLPVSVLVFYLNFQQVHRDFSWKEMQGRASGAFGRARAVIAGARP